MNMYDQFKIKLVWTKVEVQKVVIQSLSPSELLKDHHKLLPDIIHNFKLVDSQNNNFSLWDKDQILVELEAKTQ
jgi:hypothetical protein